MIVIAGAVIAPRMRAAGAAVAPPPRSPLSEAIVTSAGTARERSRSACSQSKRELARSLTVWTRALATDSKSA